MSGMVYPVSVAATPSDPPCVVGRHQTTRADVPKAEIMLPVAVRTAVSLVLSRVPCASMAALEYGTMNVGPRIFRLLGGLWALRGPCASMAALEYGTMNVRPRIFRLMRRFWVFQLTTAPDPAAKLPTAVPRREAAGVAVNRFTRCPVVSSMTSTAGSIT